MMQEHLKEEWKPVLLEGCESKYSISSYGRVYNNHTQTYVSPVLTGKPQYWYVNLQPLGGKRILRRVHRLLADAFIPNTEGLCTVDHKDRNKYNNSLDNLRWVDRTTNSYNRDVVRLFKGIPLKQYCEDKYEHPTGAYAHIFQSLQYFELTEDEAEQRYENFLKYGMHGNETVIISGKETLLVEFLQNMDMTLEEYREKRKEGLTGDDIQKGYIYPKPSKSVRDSSIEISVDGDEVFMFFLTKNSFANHLGISPESLNNRQESGCSTIKEYFEYTHKAQYTYEGFTGTLRELAVKYNLRYETVQDRVNNKGWPLEKALSTKRLKIRHYYLNGERKTKKQVFEQFLPNIKPNNIGSTQARLKCTLEEVLQYYGVDTSEISLEPCI